LLIIISHGLLTHRPCNSKMRRKMKLRGMHKAPLSAAANTPHCRPLRCCCHSSTRRRSSALARLCMRAAAMEQTAQQCTVVCSSSAAILC
jgi:hypothetical protein